MQALFYLSRQHHAENPLRLITLAQAEGFQGQELFHESVQCSAITKTLRASTAFAQAR
ncbi:MAG: hypothetical protein HOD33_10280 [Acidiferrobacteraceae bacterium]|jgi:hypothetical protein|nr:hypothetical protein [Acidiferrobacteraceae bacterium]MBT4404004.1 hypothetical protein [Acidiferrobacteraceae bacterium]